MATETDVFVQSSLKKTGFSQKWKNFRAFLWNTNTKEVMGRTGCSWAQIGLFYLVFYACLAAFFAVMLIIFYETLNQRRPKFILEDSAIGKNPGLGFRPLPMEKESSLIWIKTGNQSNALDWSKQLEYALEKYIPGNQAGFISISCVPGVSPKPEDESACIFDLEEQLGQTCSKKNYFGYKEGMPCVMIKINKVYGWEPQTYKSIDDVPDAFKQLRKNGFSQNYVMVTCEGENAIDKDNIGRIDYYPQFGFPSEFFPYLNVAGYLSPLVMVQFTDLTRGILISVECKAWAENIVHNRPLRMGSIRFELLVD